MSFFAAASSGQPEFPALPPRFTQVSKLGQGSMGVVVRAFDSQQQRWVAIKALKSGSKDDEAQRRLEREVAVLTRLEHPHVVRLYEALRVGDATLLCLELAPDGTLASLSARNPGVRVMLQALAGVAAGLEHIHAHELVHRDLKPDNILLTGEIAKISDLGLARDLDASTMLTAPGAVLGTFRYVAPEQIRSSAVDARADLYSLGVCLYEALTGQPPFVAPSLMGLLQAHLNKPAPKLRELRPDLPEALETLVDRLLAKQPTDRPQSAAEVAQELARHAREVAPS